MGPRGYMLKQLKMCLWNTVKKDKKIAQSTDKIGIQRQNYQFGFHSQTVESKILLFQITPTAKAKKHLSVESKTKHVLIFNPKSELSLDSNFLLASYISILATSV